MVNRVRNGELEVWGAGPLPSFMAAQVTNTVLSVLDLSDPLKSAPRLAFGTNQIRGERYVGEGQRSLRATIAAVGVADDFRLCSDNVSPTLFTGNPSLPIVFVPGHRYSLSFLARCSVPGNLVRVRVVLRDAAGVVRAFLADILGNWAVAASTVDLATGFCWMRHALHFVAPMSDGAGNIIASAVWVISNTTAGAQLLDLDDIRIEDLDIRRN